MDRRQVILAGGVGVLGAWLQACGGGGGSTAGAAENAGVDESGDRSSGGSTPPSVPSGGPSGRVVIVGGGMGGATLAKYLRLWGGSSMDVTLIEREAQYTSCILSSLVLSGQRTLDSLKYRYDALRSQYGVKLVIGDVVAVDPVARSVRLGSGATLHADRIVLAPGLDFEATPGPYERACLLADWLSRNKPGSTLIVLDANPDFVTEKDNFSRAFFDLHGSVIEYRTSVVIDHVDMATKTLFTNTGNVTADVVNLIPRQRAGSFVAAAGLANATGGRFAAVDVPSYESTAASGIHVIGDASATTQPKAGHIANQEAKVCADAIVRLMGGGTPDQAPVTNSACYSTITMSQASWLHALFQYDAATRTMTPVPAASGASASWNREHFKDMGTWFDALMADTFA